MVGVQRYSVPSGEYQVILELKEEGRMAELSNEDIKALGRAVNLDIQEPELTQVAYSLNAILEAMDKIDIPGLNSVEPLPIILPEGNSGK